MIIYLWKIKLLILNKKFGIIGVGGYIAPRHLKAIKDLNNDLLVAVDPSDSVGILDSFYPETSFFTIFERFDRKKQKSLEDLEKIINGY